MDPVSHVVFGHAVTAVLRPGAADRERAPGRGRALAVTLGALSPDIDFLLMPTGWDRYLAAHEIGTHSVAGVIVCGALAAGVAMLIRRPAAYRALVLPGLIGSTSHVAADLLSGAAIRVWWPFVDTRVSNLGVVAMGEPAFVAAALLGGVAMILARRMRFPMSSRAIAYALLAVFGLFILVKSAMREAAEDAYRARVQDRIGDYLVEPVWRTHSTWHVFDRTADAVRAWRVDADDRVSLALRIPTSTGDAQLIEASTSWETVRNFRGAHDQAFAVARPDGVEWSDVRYCSAPVRQVPVQCGVWAGGEFSTPPQLGRLVVRVGDLVQTR